MRGGIRAGSFVRSGPSGAPPSGLRAWETIASSSPTALGMVRPAGSIVARRDGLASWYKISGTSWLEMGILGAWQLRMLYVANTADPSVDGLAANVGVIAQSNNGAKAWAKFGPGNYDWRSLNETRASVTAAGGPSAALDVSYVAESARAFRVTIEADGAWYLAATLRLNGALVTSAAGTFETGFIVNADGHYPQTQAVIGVVSDAARGRMELEFSRCRNGRRNVLVNYSCGTTSSRQGLGRHVVICDAVTSVGFGTNGNVILDGATIDVVGSTGWSWRP